jgi:hypothetical protein
MNQTLYPLCALVAWIVVAAGIPQLPALRRDPGRMTTWVMFVSFGLVFTTGWSVVWSRLAALTGSRAAAFLITECCVMLLNGSVLVLLLLWSNEPAAAWPRIRRTVAAVGIALGAMIGLFVLSGSAREGEQPFMRWGRGAAEFNLYLLLYLLVFTVAILEIARLSWRYARLATRSWLRSGLRTAVAGALVGLLYTVGRAGVLVGAGLGRNLQGFERVAEIGAALGALLVMVGMTAPLWGPRVSALVRYARHLRAYRRLHPLWSALYARDPGIALEAPGGATGRRPWQLVWRPGQLDYHVGRRVIEIRDGILALHPHLDPAVAAAAYEHYRSSGVRGDRLDACVEAWRIRAALAAPATDRQQTAQPAALNNSPENLEAEISWLEQVSGAFRALARWTRHQDKEFRDDAEPDAFAYRTGRPRTRSRRVPVRGIRSAASRRWGASGDQAQR